MSYRHGQPDPAPDAAMIPAASENRTLRGTAAQRDAQLSRRCWFANHELVRVDAWDGAKTYDFAKRDYRTMKTYRLWFRAAFGSRTLYSRNFEGLEQLEALTEDVVDLENLLWGVRRDTERANLGRKRAVEDEQDRINAYGKAYAEVVAWDLGRRDYYFYPARPARGTERAWLVARADECLKAMKEAREKVAAIDTEVAKRIGWEPIQGG